MGECWLSFLLLQSKDSGNPEKCIIFAAKWICFMRETDFDTIISILEANSAVYKRYDDAVIINDDALNALKLFPDNSISLILTDPPYHSTKKENIVNDKSFKTDYDFLDWMEQFAVQWKRVLRPNGCGYMFCSSAMEAQLEIMLSKYFNVLAHITWTKPNEPGYDGWKGKMKKEALRQWYPHSERIIFFESSEEGNLNRSSFGNLLKSYRKRCNLTCNQLTGLIGAYGKVNHGGAVCNWESGRNIPDRDQYQKMSDVFQEIGGLALPPYEDTIRPFMVNAQVEFTDIWTFPSVKQYRGKHPAEKPLLLLEHCVKSSCYEGDIVLDCFAGSGNTLMAARDCGRLSIGIEIDGNWVQRIEDRLGYSTIF